MNGNITTAPLGGNRNIKTKPLFQYDYGQVLKIVGVTLPAAYEVHFSNQLHGVATTQIGNADGVIIPDIYLTTGEPVYAWIYLHTSNADGETEYTITIPVVRRASISDAEPTPVQQDVITQAIAALNTAVEQTAQDVQDATEAKQDAEEAAGEAYESAVTAGQYATTAGGHAADAAEASHNAEYQADRADEAKLDARAAQWAAESAQTAAEAAQAGAVAAQTGAVAAEAGAVAARDEIRNMHATANTLPAGAQATASYSDGTLTLGIPKGDKGDQGQKGDTGDRGEQGEKGEKGDTGATGATPDFEIGTVQTLPAGSSATATITGTPEDPVLNLGIPKGDKGDQGDGTPAGGLKGQVLAKASDTDHDTEWIYTAPVIKNTASGSIASFADGAEMPVDEVTVQINPVQDLHGYENPWPGGGGKNLLKTDGLSYAPPSDTEWGNTRLRTFTPNSFCVGCSVNNYYMPNQLTEYSVSENRVTVTTGGIAYGVSIPIIGLTVGETYTFSATAPEGNIQIGAWQQDGTSLGAVSTGATATTRTFTVPENAYFILICFLAKASNVQAVFTNIQLEKGSTATSFAPYSNICPITGFTGATVTRTGKNLLDDSIKTVFGSRLLIGTTNYYENPTYLKAGTYSITVFGVNQTFGYLMKSQNAIKTIVNGTNHGSFTVDNDGYYRIDLYGGTAISGDVTGVILVPGSTYATAYEPYQGETYEVEFPTEAGTVYGGSLTIAEDGSGVLNVDRAMMDMGSMVWNYNTTYAFFTSNSISTRKIGVLNLWSDLFKTMAGSWTGTPVQNALWGNGSNLTFYVQTPPIDNVSDFMSLVNGHQLMYELATPITYTLTASQITTLLGQNNLWHDANGEITVGYKANTKLYIDGKIAELVAQIVNS